jgi:Family of unknown function (DUF6009)
MNHRSLGNETRIVWLRPIEDLDYVREGIVLTTRRRGRIGMRGRRTLIGYAEVVKTGRGIVTYSRRIFWLRAHDRHFDPKGCYAVRAPCEAVDPRTVAPGIPGKRTLRVCDPRAVAAAAEAL